MSIPQSYPRLAAAPTPARKKRPKRTSFTDQFLRSLKPATPAERRYEIYDDGTSHEKYPGFGIRVTFRGVKSFFILVRRKGRLRRLTIGEYGAITLKEARVKALELRRNGKLDPPEENRIQREAPTFEELVAVFRKRYVDGGGVRPTTAEGYRRILSPKRPNGLLATFGEREATEITKESIEDWRDDRQDTPVGTNRALEVFSRAYSWAMADKEFRKLVRKNPCDGVAALKETPQNRALKRKELRAVLEAANELEPRWRDATWWMTMHGCRPADLYLRSQGRGMRWKDVDVEGREWQLPITKTDPRAVPLTDDALRVLERIRKYSTGDLVFPSLRWDDLARAIREKVGFEFQPKDLRTTHATASQKLGVMPDIIDLIQGRKPHGLRGVRQRYQKHDYWNERLAALERWHAELFALVPGPNNA